MTRKTVLDVSHLSHSYGDVHAVNDISFSLEKGEIFSFLGPNGAGKSTVINVLTTLLPIQKGTITIAGHDLLKERQVVRESIGIVFQTITLDRDMTVYETLAFHGDLYEMKRNERDNRIEELLSLVELSEKKDVLTQNLSGGMKRRLEIARGLMTRPKILFLDEPTIGLDPQTRRKTWEYLKSVNEEGTTIFLTTHYMDEADYLSDRISIIDHGQIVITSSPDSLKSSLGSDIIYIETVESHRALEIFTSFDGIADIKEKNNVLTIMTKKDGASLLPHLILELDTRNIPVLSINLKKPSMDDVFLHYTGKAMRD